MIDAGRWPLVDAAQMQALDRHTIDALGVPGEVLMESAGRAVVDALLARYGRLLGEVRVVCGAGNNGGDGLVVARHLHALGVPVRVALIGDADRLRGDAAAQYARLRAVGVAVGGADWVPPSRGVIVDALFGTGLTRDVEGPLAAAIARIDACAGESVKVVAIDLPSGLDASTGQPHGACVHADLTVTISLPKLGLALEPGRTHAGEVLVARIGIADALPGDPVGVTAQLLGARGARDALPGRPRAGHKGSFGHVLVVAGSEGKTGAAALSAMGAARAGAGLITVACPRSLNDILEAKCTEAMTLPVAETAERSFASGSLAALIEAANARDVVALGPGLSTHAETLKLVHELAAAVSRPLVVDADGLNAFAGEVERLRVREAPTVLTPHPGEAARLLGCSIPAIAADRVGAARSLAERSGAVVLLKGAATVIAEPTGRVCVNPTGGPALATGGSGDVLTGVVAALLAQGLVAFDAAALGAWLHGAAADRIAARSGSSGLIASELAAELPATVEALRSSDLETEDRFRGVSATLFSFP